MNRVFDILKKYSDCNNRDVSIVTEKLNDSIKIKKIIRLYSAVTKAYSNEYYQQNKIDYNLMIKRPIDYLIFEKYIDTLKTVV